MMATEEEASALYTLVGSNPAGVIDVHDKIERENVPHIVSRLNEAANKGLPLALNINSHGGNFAAAQAIADAVEALQAKGMPVLGIVGGKAYSTAFYLLQCCTFRAAFRHARLMAHLSHKTEELIISRDRPLAEYVERLRMIYDEDLLARDSDLKRILGRRFRGGPDELNILLMPPISFIRPTDALEQGFLDHVVG